MPENLNGLIFGQIMPDNSGPPSPFDADLDGTATQEDEFVSVTNTNATPLDVSGWQIWSISTGTGAPDPPQSGLFHTFEAGTVLAPGQTLWVINEVTGTRNYAQEASEGGVESGAGGISTNLLTEGNAGAAPEAVALVDPSTGEYIVFNMSTSTPNFSALTGFTGTTLTGTINGDAVQDDPAAGFSYQYDAATDSYLYAAAFVPCFAEGTMIDTPDGAVPVETLAPGDLILTADNGPQPVLWAGATRVSFAGDRMSEQRPIEFKPGSLGPALPNRTLVVSPQHRMLMIDGDGREVLAPAIGLTERQRIRVRTGAKAVVYHHILLPRHEIITANGVPTESFYPGDQALDALPVRHRLSVLAHFPQDAELPDRARPFVSARDAQRARAATLRPAAFVLQRAS